MKIGANVYIYIKMTIKKSEIECCFNCTHVRVTDILNGLKDGELVCPFYPEKLSTNKDMLKAYFCEEYNRSKVNRWKAHKTRKTSLSQLNPNIQLVHIKNREDMNDFFKKLFGI